MPIRFTEQNHKVSRSGEELKTPAASKRRQPMIPSRGWVSPRTDISQPLWVTCCSVWSHCENFSQYLKAFLLLQLLAAIASHPLLLHLKEEPSSISFIPLLLHQTAMRSYPVLSYLFLQADHPSSHLPAPWLSWWPSTPLATIRHCLSQTAKAEVRSSVQDAVSEAPEGNNHFPGAAGYMPLNAAQHGLGLLPCESMLLTHVHLVHQPHQVHIV